MLRNRIVGHGEEAPDQLLAHPLNWRVHPAEQQDEVEKLLEGVGWIQQIVVNKRTGHVIDGHLRIQLALKRDEEKVPVTYIDVSEKDERRILLTLDPLAAMAVRDQEKLDALRDEVATEWAEEDVDLDAILKKERTRTKGLTHDVHECACCKKHCAPGCGCYREEAG